MTYQDIHTFLTIASSSSLSKAAESLFVSQPALSHRLSALEEELGTELIIRRKGSRTLELTDAGQRFVPIARKWEQLWIETGKIKFERPSTQLRIVNVDSLGNFCFGGNAYPSDMDTIIFQQTFTIDQNGVKDDNVTNIIPCSISSDSVAVSESLTVPSLIQELLFWIFCMIRVASSPSAGVGW